MPSPAEHRWCRSALECGVIFELSCFCEHVWGSSTGSIRSGAGPVLARMRNAGLARKLGRNRFGELLHELTPAGIAAANADPLEVAQPRGVQAPAREAPPSPAPEAWWTDAHGVRWSVRDGWACWLDQHGAWIRAHQVHLGR